MAKSVGDSKSKADLVIKAAEIGISFAVFPLLLRAAGFLPISIANAAGVFLGSMLVYLVPPPIRLGFSRWLLLNVLVAVLVFVITAIMD